MLSQQFQAEDTSKYGWLIEGSLVAFNHTGGRQAIVQMFRTRTGVTATSMSMTDGVTWSRVRDTPLPNPNSKVTIPHPRIRHTMRWLSSHFLAFNPSNRFSRCQDP